MSISKQELEDLLEEFPRVIEREQWGDWGYFRESDFSFLNKNEEAAIWLLENSEVILRALSTYFEGKRPNEE